MIGGCNSFRRMSFVTSIGSVVVDTLIRFQFLLAKLLAFHAAFGVRALHGARCLKKGSRVFQGDHVK